MSPLVAGLAIGGAVIVLVIVGAVGAAYTVCTTAREEERQRSSQDQVPENSAAVPMANLVSQRPQQLQRIELEDWEQWGLRRSFPAVDQFFALKADSDQERNRNAQIDGTGEDSTGASRNQIIPQSNEEGAELQADELPVTQNAEETLNETEDPSFERPYRRTSRHRFTAPRRWRDTNEDGEEHIEPNTVPSDLEFLQPTVYDPNEHARPLPELQAGTEPKEVEEAEVELGSVAQQAREWLEAEHRVPKTPILEPEQQQARLPDIEPLESEPPEA